MEKINYKKKYPVYVKKVKKEECKLKHGDEICMSIIEEINRHPFAMYIGIFDHFTHTKSIHNCEIAENIQDAKNILFCFGKKLPEPEILAARPRSIGVCETKTHFVISFLEAPNQELTKLMVKWIEKLLNSI